MISEFLVVLVVSLLFGNGLLYFTSKKENSGLVSLKEEIEGDKSISFSAGLSDTDVEEIYSNQASLRSANEKIKLAHERISDLENTLQSMNSVIHPGSSDVEEKIKKLEDFKRLTKIELKAIKDLLKQLKEFRKISVKKRTPALIKKEKDLNKRIHELVFNTKKHD